MDMDTASFKKADFESDRLAAKKYMEYKSRGCKAPAFCV